MENKFQKRKDCLYCGKDLDAKYRSKKFCGDKCRIYYGREQKIEKLLNKAFEENKVVILETTKDLINTGTSITKVHEKGKFKRISPMSEEAKNVMNEVEKMIWEEEQNIINNKNK